MNAMDNGEGSYKKYSISMSSAYNIIGIINGLLLILVIIVERKRAKKRKEKIPIRRNFMMLLLIGVVTLIVSFVVDKTGGSVLTVKKYITVLVFVLTIFWLIQYILEHNLRKK